MDVPKISESQKTILRLSRVHFLYIIAFAASIVVYHAGNLVTPEAILKRWTIAGCMLVLTTIVWGLAHSTKPSPVLYKILVSILILMDIILASSLVYAERGMAGLGVALYAIPIAVSAVLASRTALIGTTILCFAAYAFSCIKYFVDFFNEGYKLQLYATIGFYGAVFFVLAALLAIIFTSQRSKR